MGKTKPVFLVHSWVVQLFFKSKETISIFFLQSGFTFMEREAVGIRGSSSEMAGKALCLTPYNVELAFKFSLLLF